MSDSRLPVPRQTDALTFDPRSPSPLIRRGMERLKELTPVEAVTALRLKNDWPMILSEVKRINRRLEALLQYVWPQSVDHGRVELASNYEFHREKISSDDMRLTVEEVLQSIYHQKFDIVSVKPNTDVPL